MFSSGRTQLSTGWFELVIVKGRRLWHKTSTTSSTKDVGNVIKVEATTYGNVSENKVKTIHHFYLDQRFEKPTLRLQIKKCYFILIDPPPINISF